MITDLSLKQQTKNILLFNGITTIDQLKRLTLQEARQMRGIGRGSINDIINALSKYGANSQNQKMKYIKEV